MEYIDQFQQPLVRDLAWVMASPSLLNSVNDRMAGIVSDAQCQEFIQANLGWLQALDDEPAPLISALSNQKSSRLGYYFEGLVAYWLRQKISDGYFESHLKVTANKSDLGEFDFLFSANKRFYHWETAVKFYLYTSNHSGEVSWYGPNANDTFYKKLSRMIQHQVRLSEFEDAESLLAKRGIDRAQLEANIFLKGYLFYPLTGDFSNAEFAVANCVISSTHLKGWWLRVSELKDRFVDLASQNNLRWRQLPKHEWLAPRVYCDDEGLQSLLTQDLIESGLHLEFEKSDQARLIAGYSQDQQGNWREQTRGFIVNRRWPDADHNAA